MKIRIKLDAVPSLLFVGFKKEIGTKPIQPTPFLFFSPDVPPESGYHLHALLKAETFLKINEVLLAVDPVDFTSSHGIARVAWNEFYNSAYALSEHEVERMSMLLKQADWQSRRLKAATLAQEEQLIKDAIAAGSQELDEQPTPPVASIKTKPVVPPVKKSIPVQKLVQKKSSKKRK